MRMSNYGGIWGQLPYTTGNVFFVAPASSTVSSYTIEGQTFPCSDGNDGKDPSRALSTIHRARALATANNGDIVALLPGTHNASTQTGQTASGAIACSKAGITYVGIESWGPLARGIDVIKPRAIITAPAATIAVNVTAADNRFINLSFLPITQLAGIDFTTAADRLSVWNCFFDLTTPAGHLSTKGIAATGATQAPNRVHIEGCVFEEDNSGSSQGPAIDIGAGIAFRIARNHCYNIGSVGSETAWAVAMQVNDVAHGLFDGNYFYTMLGSSAAITAGIKGVTMAGTGILSFWHNKFAVSVTNPITGFAASDVDLNLNYVATVAGGSGGSLITSST